MLSREPKETILVVDDDRGMLRLIEKVLRREGWKAVCVPSGLEAIDWLSKNRANLMLLDLQLQDIEGKELINHLQSIGLSLPFAIITGQGDERLAVEMMKRGAFDYLVKDVNFLEFIPTVVRRFLDQIERNRKYRQTEKQARLAGTVMDQAYSAVAIFTGNPKQPSIVYTNRAFAELTGIPTDRLAYCSIEDLEAGTGSWRELRKVMTSGSNFIGEMRFHHSSGNEIETECTIVEIETPDSAETHWAVILHDITSRKLAENSLRKSERALSSFFSNAPVGLIWLDPQGTILRANAAFLEIVGHPENLVVGHSILEFAAGPELSAFLPGGSSTSQIIRNNTVHLKGSGNSVKHVLIDGVSVLKDGRLARQEWFVRDITRRLELEREILRISEREQRRFGQDLHDDLCQTLTGIGFRCDTLARQLKPVSPKGHRAAAGIAKMIRETTAHARDLARGMAPVQMDSDGLADSLKELAARTSKTFDVHCRFNCREPIAIQDEAVGIHLYRIAQEAVGNAVKHACPRRIDIELASQDGRVVLAVKDDGRGFPKRPKNTRGMGLRVMQYRAGVIGGSLAVHRESPRGTAVVCTVNYFHLRPPLNNPRS